MVNLFVYEMVDVDVMSRLIIGFTDDNRINSILLSISIIIFISLFIRVWSKK